MFSRGAIASLEPRSPNHATFVKRFTRFTGKQVGSAGGESYVPAAANSPVISKPRSAASTAAPGSSPPPPSPTSSTPAGRRRRVHPGASTRCLPAPSARRRSSSNCTLMRYCCAGQANDPLERQDLVRGRLTPLHVASLSCAHKAQAFERHPGAFPVRHPGEPHARQVVHQFRNHSSCLRWYIEDLVSYIDRLHRDLLARMSAYRTSKVCA